MDPLWSETCCSTFKYFIILSVSTYYIMRISWINIVFIYHWCTVQTWRLKKKKLAIFQNCFGVLSRLWGKELRPFSRLKVSSSNITLWCGQNITRELGVERAWSDGTTHCHKQASCTSKLEALRRTAPQQHEERQVQLGYSATNTDISHSRCTIGPLNCWTYVRGSCMLRKTETIYTEIYFAKKYNHKKEI